MVDSFDPNKIQQVIEQIKSLKKDTSEYDTAVKTAIDLIREYGNEIDKTGRSLSSLGEKTGDHSKEIQDVIEKKKSLIATQKSLQEALKSRNIDVESESLKALSGAVTGLVNKMTGGKKASSAFSSNLTSQLVSTLRKSAIAASAFGSDFAANVINPLSDFSPISGFNAATKRFNTAMKGLLQTQSVAREHFIGLGVSVGDAHKKSLEYLETLRKTSTHLSISTKDQQAFNQQVGALPGVFDPATASLQKATDVQNKMTQTAGILQTALRRFKMSGSEAGQAVQQAFLQSGISANQFAEFLGQANAAMRGTDVDSKIALQQMLQTNRVMGIFGDQASRVTGVWSDFTRTLRGSGVAINEIGNIVGSVTQGIANMSTQNRAFISMMSGMFQGATALGGALKMELAMRSPGGLEQNLEALTGTLSRFGGGNIITLEEAANNPQLEMQFTLQRQMLQKMGIGTTQEQQNRILEVLQGVRRGGISRLEGSKELSQVMNKGRNIQEQLLTALEKQEMILRDKIFTTMENKLGGIYDQMVNLNAAMGMGRAAQEGRTKMFASTTSLITSDKPDRFKRGMKDLGLQLHRQIIPGGQEGERREGQIARPSRENIVNTIMDGLKNFGEGLRGITDRISKPRDIRQARIPKTPSAALISERKIDEDRKTTIASRVAGATTVVGEAKTTEPTATAGGTKKEVVLTKTESNITIKVDAQLPKLKEFIKKILEKEIPKHVNGEIYPGE